MVSKSIASVSFVDSVQDLLPRVEERMHAISDSYHQDLRDALEYILNSGGKRIRPTLNLLIGNMLGANTEKLILSAAAVEMLHTATLVHDDLIDGSLLRRGNATLNANWSPIKTVLTGDLLFAYAAVLASDTESVQVVRMFSETLATIVNGEITQQFTSLGRASRDDYYKRIHAKTASLFEASATLAALLSPVDSEVVSQVHRFGYEIGMAFQIMDDILDFTGEQAEVGKPIGNDLRQGLITLPALYYFEDNKEVAGHMFNNGNASNGDMLSSVIDKIRMSDAIEKSLEEAAEFIDRSKQTLSKLPDSVERNALADLADYIIKRSN